MNSKDGSGCRADIGRKGGSQIFNIGNCSSLSVIHEFAHTIGMFHEHNRSDRDSYITVHWDRIRKDKRQNFQINGTESENIRKYDYASITHYSNNTFSVSRWPTITTLNGEEIGRRNGLSMGDIYAINYMYPNKYNNKKVVLYSKFDYEGSKYELKNSSPLLGDFTMETSSLIIPNGWSVILYQGKNYTGNHIIIKNSTLKINNDFNNNVSSVHIIKNTNQNTVLGDIYIYKNPFNNNTELFKLIKLDKKNEYTPIP
ncbi:M12 family metallopeptidase [Photobacterium leiognathi subsp. mandapamensis]